MENDDILSYLEDYLNIPRNHEHGSASFSEDIGTIEGLVITGDETTPVIVLAQ